MSERNFFSVRTPRIVDLAIAVRGVAATAVVWWHTGGNATTENWARALTPSGRLAVWIFFIHSGYMMGSGFFTGRYKFTRKDLIDFYFNRWLRIYPLFFLVLLASYVVHVYLGDLKDLSPSLFFSEASMTRWNHEYKLNGVFWTLGIEMQFYLLAPLLFFVQFKWNKPIVAAALGWLVALVVCMTVVRLPGNSIDCRNWPGNWVHFQAGIFLATARPAILNWSSDRRRFILKCAAGLSVVVLLYLNLLYFQHFDRFLGPEGIVLGDTLGVMILTAHIILEGKGKPATTTFSIFAGLGVLSYGIYAWHGALGFFPELEHRFWIQTPLALALCYTTYLLLEKPLAKLKRSGHNLAHAR